MLGTFYTFPDDVNCAMRNEDSSQFSKEAGWSGPLGGAGGLCEPRQLERAAGDGGAAGPLLRVG